MAAQDYVNIRAYRWAAAQPIKSPVQKSVLQCIAARADKEGFAWPSQGKIAQETSLTVRTVRTAMKALEDAGYIAREKRGNAFNKGRSPDLVLIGMPTQHENKEKPFTGNSRPIYRKELPTNNTGNNSKYPSHDEKFSKGSRVEDTRERPRNVVAFPGVEWDEEYPFGRASA